MSEQFTGNQRGINVGAVSAIDANTPLSGFPDKQ